MRPLSSKVLPTSDNDSKELFRIKELEQRIRDKRKEWKQLELCNSSKSFSNSNEASSRRKSSVLLKEKIEEFEKSRDKLTKLERLEKSLQIETLVLKCVEGGAVVTEKAKEGTEFIGDLLKRINALEFYDFAAMFKMLKSLTTPTTSGMTTKEAFKEISKGFALMLVTGNILFTAPFVFLTLGLSFIPWENNDGASDGMLALILGPGVSTLFALLCWLVARLINPDLGKKIGVGFCSLHVAWLSVDIRYFILDNRLRCVLRQPFGLFQHRVRADSFVFYNHLQDGRTEAGVRKF